MNEATRRLVCEEAVRVELTLTATAADLLTRYVDLLVRWGQRIRLTGSQDPSVLVQRHLVDALVAARAVAGIRGAGADIGSGGGIPGIPLGILLPDMRLFVVEANQRKSAFLRTAVHDLGLKAEVIGRRLEDASLPPLNLVCSRATWSPEQWLSRGVPLLRPSGQALVFGVRLEDLPPPPVGAELDRCVSYTLSDGTPRALGVYRVGSSR